MPPQRPCASVRDLVQRYDITPEQAQAILDRMMRNTYDDMLIEALMSRPPRHYRDRGWGANKQTS